MSFRTFVDSTGKQWEVWLVTPAAAERRKADRRAPAGGAGAANFPGFSDRRRTPDRRLTPERRQSLFRRNAEVASEYSSGWLCFECDGDKRRLAPVPDDWYQAGPDRLVMWLETAKRVVKCAP